ncbi:MAG: hypothetical protein WDZ83_12970 [Rhizobiaceae bacterium]
MRKKTIERMYAGFEDKPVSRGLLGGICSMSLRDKHHQKKAFLSTGCRIVNKQKLVEVNDRRPGQITNRRAGFVPGAA